MNLKKIALAVALTSTVSASLAFSTAVGAAPRSYYDFALTLKNERIQKSFVESMIRNYTRAVSSFQTIVDRYKDRFGGQVWFQNIENQLTFYKTELNKFELLVSASTSVVKTASIVVVDTRHDISYKTTVERSPTREASTQENIVEETVDSIVKVYAVLTRVLETDVTTTEYKTTITTTYYSNNTQESKTQTDIARQNVNTESQTLVSRELIREYAIVVEESTEQTVVSADIDGEIGTPTVNVLTPEEYLARDDVSLTGTDTYKQAVWKMNSKINEDYITRDGGLAIYGSGLEAIGAPIAWSRGWTGAGSTIAILDTGIDLDHPEFEGRILDSQCFVGTCTKTTNPETVQDGNKLSHGTHVAGIAAAALDGKGTTGVAPDANLLIAKTAYNNGFYDLGAAAEAITWAAKNGADVINVSGNYNVSTEYSKALTEIAPGLYTLKDNGTASQKKLIGYEYDVYSFAGLLKTDKWYSKTNLWTTAMSDHEAVVVAAAGNQRLGFSTFPAHWAVLEDENGDLVMGGRMLVVGNYDLKLQKLASSSNAAGTVCYDYNETQNTCNSTYRIKDFYIMAPGQYVASTDSNGEYRTNSGTSMAAPVVTGAVAVIHQMWPHMKGENLVKLLLNTASKDIPNYDENVHGQGLLNLDNATRPQGAIGIPTGGRVDGEVNIVTGGVAVQGGTISALTEVMVIDDYDREFFLDAKTLVSTADTRTMSYTVAHKNVSNSNAYMGFASTQNLGGKNTLLGMSENGSEMNIAYDFDNGITLGLLTEDNSFLGNVADSAMMRVTSATTVYTGYNFEYEYKDVTLFGGSTLALTKANVDDSTMLKDIDMLVSNTANLGATYAMKNSEVGMVAALPVSIVSGDAHFKVASSVNSEGTINYDSVSGSMATGSREYNLGAFYNLNVTDNAQFSVYAEQRFNYAGIQGEQRTEAGVEFKVAF
jgi:subtilisin family serine protease